MRSIVLAGQSNAGKTFLMIGLVESLDERSLQVLSTRRAEPAVGEEFSFDEAISRLTGPELNTTIGLSTVDVKVRVRKSALSCRIIDTTGLADSISPVRSIRLGMAETLKSVRDCEILLHVVDADRVGRQGLDNGLAEVDYELTQLGLVKGGYCLIANKADLPSADAGIAMIRSRFPRLVVLRVSALRRSGLPEVKRFVRSQL